MILFNITIVYLQPEWNFVSQPEMCKFYRDSCLSIAVKIGILNLLFNVCYNITKNNPAKLAQYGMLYVVKPAYKYCYIIYI